MSLFPTDDKGRKVLPVLRMITGYFPKAMREITRVCVANNVRYNPGRDPADINWARGKSPDQLGSAFRHMLEAIVDGAVFEKVPEAVTTATGITQVYVLAEAAWRINAALELAIEKQEAHEADIQAVLRAQRAIADQRPEWGGPMFPERGSGGCGGNGETLIHYGSGGSGGTTGGVVQSRLGSLAGSPPTDPTASSDVRGPELVPPGQLV